MSIYTKTGDNGTTGLFNGTRVSKDSEIIDVLGNIDELNAFLGIIVNNCQKTKNVQVTDILQIIQTDLFNLGTVIANPTLLLTADKKYITDLNIKYLEQTIDKLSLELPELVNFILPGGCSAGAKIHFSRAICRKTERSLVAFKNIGSNKFVNELKYLNRLSDLLFVLARYINKLENTPEIIWKS